MKRMLFLSLLFSLFFTSPIYAVRSLPPGVQPKSMKGEAVGSFSELKGSGTLTFTNIGGDARLVTVCGDVSAERARVNSLTCEGIDIAGTFSGGPNGVAVFKTGSGEIKLQLTDGKVFSFAAQGVSMDFTVTDPSIFDAWVENIGARDSGARVSDLSGQVEIACPPDLEAWDVMKMGRVIYVDCHLKTGEDSSAVISFSDMTTFTMKSESEVILDTPPEKDSKWSLLAGNIWVNVKQMVKDGTMKVHMSQAVAGIKGTTFILNETKTESTIKVIEGNVAFSSKNTKDSVQVNAGESVTGTETGLSVKTNFDVLSETNNWQGVIDSTKKQIDVEKINPQITISNIQNILEQNKKILYGIGGVLGLIILVSLGLLFQRRRQHIK